MAHTKRNKPFDLTGVTFGRLTAIRIVGRESSGGVLWLCRCVCGKTKSVAAASLRSSRTKSCGCLQRETAHKTFLTHDQYKSSEYRIWKGIRQRCFNPKNPEYHRYGGRGITVCRRWQGVAGFVNFLQDMGPRPAGTSIERIKNHLDYEPGNCRWATPAEQSRNTRRTVRLTWNGKTQCLADWAKELGMSSRTLRARRVYGWSVERMLTEPVRQ